MSRLARSAMGLAAGALLGGCFKLNPEFSPRVDDGQRVLFVFDERRCEGATIEAVEGDAELLASDEPCTPCTPEGLRFEGCDRSMEATVTSRDPLDLGPGDAFTIEAWVSMDPQATEARLLTLGDDELRLMVGPGHAVWFTYEPPDERIPTLTGTGPSGDGGPWHFAIVHDGTSSRLFIDGVQADGPLEQDLPSLGTRTLTLPGNIQEPWVGTLHLLAVYDRALELDEYLLNHQAGPYGEGELSQ